MPRPITSDIVFELPALSAPAISPDGESIAYVRSQPDGETMEQQSHIEVVPFGGGDARRLTGGPRDSAPAWSPDGATLAFLRPPEEEKPPQVWLIETAGGEARQLSDLRGGVASMVWMPDGGSLVCVSRVDPDAPDEEKDDEPKVPRVRVVSGRIRYRGDGEGWFGRARAHLFAVDAGSGEAEQLTRGDHNHTRPVPSPDGTTIAFVSSDRSRRRHLREPMGGELCLMPSSGGAVRRLVRDGWSLGPLAWSPDGGRIAFTADERSESQRYVYTVEVARGEVSRITSDELTPQAQGSIAWTPSVIVLSAFVRAASGVYAVSPAGRVRTIRARREFVTNFVATPDGRRAAAITSTTTRPDGVMSLDLRTGRTHVAAASSDAYIEDRAIAKTERFRIRRGGVPIEGWLTFPPGFDPERRYPLVLSIHGGPHAAFFPDFRPVNQLLAATGCLVLSMDPRGSMSYGGEFARAVNGDWGGEDYLDLMAAVDVAARRPYVDERRLGVYGYSYGGYMSAWIVGQTDRFAAAVVGAPVIDIATSYLQDDIGVALADVEWGGTPFERAEWYRERSPITHAPNVETPVLLLHGEDDLRCPIGDSEAYYTALTTLGKTVEFVRFPDSSHGFPGTAHPALRKEYLDRVAEWFERWLKPSRRARR
jgi:dipeptidyl aminopeptidase/acylaminoacyl peptidase